MTEAVIMADSPPLADRVRAALAAGPPVREVHMFGGLSFMVNGRMVVAVGGDGGLLVRVAPERGPELAARPGAAPAEMGAGRTMGPSWIQVAGTALATNEQLSFWIAAALQFNDRAGPGGR